MQRFRKLASMMGVEHAIILAPMAGGTSTPALVAAVSNAGGLGSLGAGYMTPDDIAKAIAEIHERTSKPFAVNLFAGGYDGTGSSDTAAMLKLIAPWHERLGLPPPAAPAWLIAAVRAAGRSGSPLGRSGVQLHLRHSGG
jgi:nitronate monooxygenase